MDGERSWACVDEASDISRSSFQRVHAIGQQPQKWYISKDGSGSRDELHGRKFSTAGARLHSSKYRLHRGYTVQSIGYTIQSIGYTGYTVQSICYTVQSIGYTV